MKSKEKKKKSLCTENARDDDGNDTEFVSCTVCLRNTVHDPFPERILVCDACGGDCHMRCVDPPLEEVPDGCFICPPCYQKQKAKMKPVVNAVITEWKRNSLRETKQGGKTSEKRVPVLSARQRAISAHNAMCGTRYVCQLTGCFHNEHIQRPRKGRRKQLRPKPFSSFPAHPFLDNCF